MATEQLAGHLRAAVAAEHRGALLTVVADAAANAPRPIVRAYWNAVHYHLVH